MPSFPVIQLHFVHMTEREKAYWRPTQPRSYSVLGIVKSTDITFEKEA